MIFGTSRNNGGYFIDLIFYIRNELNFPKCLEILKKHKNDISVDSLRIIGLYVLKK